MNPLRHAMALGTMAILLLGCSAKTEQLNEELQLALGQDLRGQYSVESIADQVAVGSSGIKATIVFTEGGHQLALAAIPATVRQPTETGFEYSTYRKEDGGFRYFLIHLSERERRANVQFGEQ